LHRSRKLAVGAAKLLEQHVAKGGIGFVDANRVHELLYVMIHRGIPQLELAGGTTTWQYRYSQSSAAAKVPGLSSV
jgi:hypothetical protein